MGDKPVAAITLREKVRGDCPTCRARSFTPIPSPSLGRAQATALETLSLDAARSPIAM
jgi:hypothetical protein